MNPARPKVGELWKVVTDRRYVWAVPVHVIKHDRGFTLKTEIGLVLSTSTDPDRVQMLMSWGPFQFPEKFLLTRVSEEVEVVK